MAFGYCTFHKKYLSLSETKEKRCRCKANTKKMCRYFILTAKLKYVNRR